MFNHDDKYTNKRLLIASFVVVLITFSLTARLWYLQIYKGDYYAKISENNRIRRIESPAPRGVIYDRYNQVILGNRPFFDLIYIPQYIEDKEKSLKAVSSLLSLPYEGLFKTVKRYQNRPIFLPIVLKKNLTIHEVSLIESFKVLIPGIDISIASRRNYQASPPAHLVGYMGEISRKKLSLFNKKPLEVPYLPGDLIGKQGLEKVWEPYLRGQNGYNFIQVNAFGHQTTAGLDTLRLPTKKAKPGANLTLTIDKHLQKVATEAFKGKNGAIVSMIPSTGEILIMLSSPSYNPEIYQDNLSYEKWRALIQNPYKPLFDKTTGGSFAPGSIYKPIVALAALEEGIVKPDVKHNCRGSFELGIDKFHCHKRTGHGKMNLVEALMTSCDYYFYKLGVELGIDRIAKYAKMFGLGNKTGIQLNKEEAGLIPTQSWSKKTTGRGLQLGDIPPVSIGQGANLLTPLQMASMYSTLATEGKTWKPFLVKKITDHSGKVVFENTPTLMNHITKIKKESFQLINHGLLQVIENPKGTGKRGKVKGHKVAGKTGSVQVVSLKKNRNRNQDVSMKWQEHAMFAAFSPLKNPEIVVVIVSENDKSGGGSSSAAPIAKKIIQAYWDRKEKGIEKSLLKVSRSNPTGETYQ